MENSVRPRRRQLAGAAMALVALGVLPAHAGGLASNEVTEFGGDSRLGTTATSGRRTVTITFTYYVDADAANRPETSSTCSLRVARGSNGTDVFRAAVSQNCIRSFRTVRDQRREMLQCINDMCAHATNSPGLVPDTRWDVLWTGGRGKYARSGLKGYAASAGDTFRCELYLVN